MTGAHPKRPLVCAVAMLALAAACGKDTPTSPTPSAPPALVALTLSPSVSTVVMGHSVRLTAHATYSDGNARVVDPVWSAAPSTVATIDSAGTLTMLRAGAVAVTASFAGQTAARSLRVVPDFGGTWDGVVRVTQCLGRFPHSCSPSDSTERRITLWAEQTDARVRAFLYISSSDRELFVDGEIGTDGVLGLRGERVEPDISGPYIAIRIDEWRTEVDRAGALVGEFTGWTAEYPLSDASNPSRRRRYLLLDVRRTAPGR